LERDYRQRDGKGRVIAGVGDYGVVASLLSSYFGDLADGLLTSCQRKAAQAVMELADGTGVGLKTVAKKVGIDPSTACRHLQALAQKGYILAEGHGAGRRFRPGEALPVAGVLPDPREMAQELGLAGEWIDPLTGQVERVSSGTGATGATAQ
jgi:hypothetical protein